MARVLCQLRSRLADEAQFDQSTYLGRVRHFLKAVNPL
tara:strand:- start:410 stop:523 length:114 start_codon:yes stop_codon:yes gene_type:complete